MALGMKPFTRLGVTEAGATARQRAGREMQATKVGAALWIGCLQYFAAEAIAIQGWHGSYSLSLNYISDLAAVHCVAGAICSPLHPLMNASFLLQGALILSGAVLLWPRLAQGGMASLGLGLVGASGLGVFLVGLAPEDVSPTWHYVGAVENFLFCNAGAALIGAALFSRHGTVGGLGMAAGVLGLAGIACIGAHAYFGLGAGGMERVTAYPFPLWIAGMGIWLWRNANPWTRSPTAEIPPG
jgi:hypothetical membrane protein